MLVESDGMVLGKKYSADIPGITDSFLDIFSRLDFSDQQIRRTIDGMAISADAKSALYAISSTSIRVGQRVIQLGRKIIDYIITLFREFPNAGYGLILGGILGFLVATVPVVGAVLGPMAKSLAVIFGFVIGVKEDLSDKKLERKIREINSEFSVLAGNDS